MSDIDILKAIVEREAEEARDGAGWNVGDIAVNRVLVLLHENATPTWQSIYDAIKSAYVGPADWEEQ